MEVEKEMKGYRGNKRDSLIRIQRCQESLKDMYADSNIFVKSEGTSHMQLQDVETGSIIGKGTFGQIRSLKSLLYTHETSVTQMSSRHSNSSNYIDDEDEDGNPQSTTDPISGLSPQNYVLKEIRKSILNNGDAAIVDAAAIDLARESRFLQLLSHHENIINFHSTGGCEGSRNFFILMEKINKTLDVLIEREWKPLQKNISSIAVQKYLKDQVSIEQHDYDLSKTSKGLKREATNNFLLLRLQVIVGIAFGLSFLHEHK